MKEQCAQAEKDSLVVGMVQVWEKFCKLHYSLYKATEREYSLLLENRIDAIDDNIKFKIKIINEIKGLEIKRRAMIERFNRKNSDKIRNIEDLIKYVCKDKTKEDLIEKYNGLLVETIAKIQDQNKKNQIFINKAIYNLKTIKKDVFGQESSYSTYNSRGVQQQSF